MAPQQEIVAHTEQHVDVGLENEAMEQVRKSSLNLGPVLREQLLELIHDQDRTPGAAAPSGHDFRRHFWIVEAQEKVHSPYIAGHLWGESTAQGKLWIVARLANEAGPGGTGIGHQARLKERGLSSSGRADQREHPRWALELAPHLLDLGLAAEEVLGVCLGEGSEAGVGVEVVGAFDAEGHVLEGAGQGVGGVEAAFAVFLDGLLDHRSPRRVGDLGGLGAHALPDALPRVEALDAVGAHHLGEHHAGGVDVGSRIERLSRRLLGRHVGRSARHRAAAFGLLPGQPEIHHHDPARPGEHDVFRFDVAVDQPGLVDGLEACEKLRGDVLRFFEVERPAFLEDTEQGRAIDVLHRHQLATLDLDQVEDPADVGRYHFAGGSHFLAQQLEAALGFEELRPQGLQRHFDPQLEVEGVPHLAHPAAAQHLDDLVALAEYLPGHKAPHPLGHVEGLALRLGASQRFTVRRRLPVHDRVSSLS